MFFYSYSFGFFYLSTSSYVLLASTRVRTMVSLVSTGTRVLVNANNDRRLCT
jgi:hypothetical protein